VAQCVTKMVSLLCLVLVQLPQQKNDADTQHSDFNSQGSHNFRDDNRTEVASNQNYGTEDSTQHSDDIDDSAENHTMYKDPYYVVTGPNGRTDVEVKKLDRRKLQNESSTNEVHSYHIDLSAYYASSQTVSTSNLFIVTIAVFFLMWCTAH